MDSTTQAREGTECLSTVSIFTNHHGWVCFAFMLSLLAIKRSRAKIEKSYLGKQTTRCSSLAAAVLSLSEPMPYNVSILRLQLELHSISGVEESRALAGTEMDVSIINSKVSTTSGLASRCCTNGDFLSPTTQPWQLPVPGEFSQEPCATQIQHSSEPWFYR